MEDNTPMNQGQGPSLTDRTIGEAAGEPFVTLITSEMPLHSHNWGGTNTVGDQPVANPSNVLAQSSTGNAYQTNSSANLTQFYPLMLTVAGSSFPHNHMMPYLVCTFIIAMQGIFPARS